MTTTRVTSTDFQRDYDLLSDRARREPVVITLDGRDALVVVSADEFARLSRRDRTVGLAADLPEEWLDAVLAAEVSAGHDNLNAELE